MPSVSFDPQYPIHRKVDGLSDAAFRLHTSAIFWCFRNTTDGFIPTEDLDLVCPRLRGVERLAAECVRRGVWHQAEQACTSENCPGPASEGGWVIHDYFEHQPTKEEVRAEHDGKSDGGSFGNHLRWHKGRNVVKPGCPHCLLASSDNRSEDPSDNRSQERSHLRSVPDRTTESGANPSRARADPGSKDLDRSKDLSDLIDQAADRYARALDDDDFLKSIIGLINDRTGRVVTAGHAKTIASTILAAAKRHPDNLGAYIRTAIRNEPNPKGRFLPPAEDEPAPEPGPCGECDRGMREKPDGTPYRCPVCRPAHEAAPS